MPRSRSSGPPHRTRTKAADLPEILAFVEGAKTEEGYLVDLARRQREFVRVHIDDFHGVPYSLVERAVAAKQQQERDERRGHGRAYDEIWCVFDRDEHHRMAEAVALAAKHGISVAVSNPCIELWFILHFEDQTAHIERDPAQARSEALLKCGKTLKLEALTKLWESYDEAAKRALALDKKHHGDGSPPRANPSSEVWKLVGRIRNPGEIPRTPT